MCVLWSEDTGAVLSSWTSTGGHAAGKVLVVGIFEIRFSIFFATEGVYVSLLLLLHLEISSLCCLSSSVSNFPKSSLIYLID